MPSPKCTERMNDVEPKYLSLNDKHNNFFKPNENTNIRNPDKFDVPFAHTTKYFKSPKLYKITERSFQK